MKRHGSMNRVYRLIWSCARSAWVPVAEIARGRGKSSLRKLVVTALSLVAAAASAAPEGGQVTAGAGSIAQTGATTTITQSGQNLALNWQSFNVGSSETVNFAQPSASAVAVNRIFDTNGSQILGHLNANGQVYLINPNGVLFGQGAQVNVGSLVASTLDFNDTDLAGSTRHFSGAGAGSVLNQGRINTANGGYVAFIGQHVGNQGTIISPQGAVALAAGSAVTLTFQAATLAGMQVDQSVLNNLAENGGLIQANGGMVVMSAGAKNSVLASVVNNTGVIEAQTVENRAGSIVLLGGMQAGIVNVASTLDASAPNGGNGGFIETSAAHVNVADDAKITTAASLGLAGTWLIDPVDFTVAASGGDMTGATLSSNLGGGNVVIQSSSGSTGTLGDVNINDAVTWAANKLTLNAFNNVNINANLNASSTASLALEYGQGAVAASNASKIVAGGGAVNLPASTTNFTTKQGSNGAVKNYTVITSLGAAGSTTATDLQGIAGNLTGNYALGSNIDAAVTSTWNAGAGFAPIGNGTTRFAGIFDGLGHTISGVYINRTAANTVGLFGYTAAGSLVRNVGLIGGSVASTSWGTGALVGALGGTLFNSYATGSVSGFQTVGGLVGVIDGGAIIDSHATGSVTSSGNGEVGGLVGLSWGPGGGTVSNSYATGNVSSTVGNVGGLMGINWGHITDSYATGTATGTDLIGGLVGNNSLGSVASSYSTGAVSGRDNVGGLVGNNSNTVSTSYATGAVTGRNNVGGVAGSNSGSIGTSHAGGNVNGTAVVGGLIGLNQGAVTDAYATGAVAGSTFVGGLIGLNEASIARTYAAGAVTGDSYVGGLVGKNVGGAGGYGSYGTGSVGAATTIDNSYATGAVAGSNFVGGLVGANAGGVGGSAYGSPWGAGYGGQGGNAVINKSYSAGAVTGTTNVGGLVGGALTGGPGDIYGYGPGTNYVYGVAGVGGTSAVNNSYWNTTTSGRATSQGGGGLTTAQMQQKSNFASWDFANTWIGYDGHTNPLLRTFMTALTVTATNASKTYDGLGYSGGNGVTYSVTPNRNLLGTVSYSGTSQGANNANNYVITAGGLYSSQQGYIISYVDGALTVNKADLAVSGTRIYDGTSVVAGSALTATGVAGQAFSMTGAGNASNLASKNVQTGSALATLTGLTLGISANGGVSSNYNTLSTTGSSISITRANLTLGTSDVIKTYDGSLAASGAAVVTGGTLFSGDTLGVGTFAFTNANVGAGNKTVTTSGVSVNDGNSGSNYNITYANNTTSTINMANLILSSGNVAKTYDGGLSAAGSATVVGGVLFGGDSLSGGSFAFTDKNAGSNKTVTTAGVTVNDSNGGANYSVSYANNTASVINAESLVVSTSNITKTYDGTLAAPGTAIITGGTLFGSDSLSGGSFVFTDKNAGSGNKTVTAADVIVNDGNSGGNYSISYIDNTANTINAADLFIAGVTANNKIYDGTVLATLAGAADVAAFGTDVIAVNGPGAGMFVDAEIGAAKAVTVSGFTLSGADAGNYNLIQPLGLTADITSPPIIIAPSATVAEIQIVAGQIQSNFLAPTVAYQFNTDLSPSIETTQISSVSDNSSSLSAADDSKPNAKTKSEVNTKKSDRRPNAALLVVNGGVALPANAVNVNE